MRLNPTTLVLTLGSAAMALTIPAFAADLDTGVLADTRHSPEALSKEVMTHVKAGDQAAIERLFLPVELLEKVARCEDDDDDLRDDLRESRRELPKLFKKHGGTEFVRLEVDKLHEVSRDSRFEDCVAKENLGWFEGDIHTSRGDDFDVDMLRIGSRWYLVDFDD